MSTDYALTLTVAYPNTQWSLVGDDYDGLVWFDDTKKPTRAELDSAWVQVQSDLAMQRVERQRKVAYREESDPLFFEYQRGDATEQEWLDAVQAVKDRYPYPTV